MTMNCLRACSTGRKAPNAILKIVFIAFLNIALGTSLSLATATEAPPAITVSDTGIHVEELKLMLKPLTRAELLVEADAWQALVQEKATEISAVEIAAAKKLRETQLTEDSAKEGMQTPEPAAAKAKDAAKVSLLEQANALRDERTSLLDRLRTVLDATEAKTDPADAETMKKIQDLRLYATAVSGLQVNVQDTTSAWIAIRGWLTSEEGGMRWAFNIAEFVGIIAAAWIIAGLLSRLIHHALQGVKSTTLMLEKFLVRAVRWIAMALGLIMALAALEVSIGPLLAMVGAAGFVLAFALQDSLSNFASGLMILFFSPFDEGDTVDAGGVSGKVESVNLVSTTIMTFDNKRMVVPNNMIWNDVITNATDVNERRVDMEFGIGYDDDVDKAREILEEIISEHPKVLDDPEPTVRLHTLADSSVVFIARPWARTADYWDVRWDVTRQVKLRFDQVGIGIPFPQRDVHVYMQNSESGNPA